MKNIHINVIVIDVGLYLFTKNKFIIINTYIIYYIYIIVFTHHIPRIKSSNNPGNTKSSVPANHLRPNISIDGIVVVRRPGIINHPLYII